MLLARVFLSKKILFKKVLKKIKERAEKIIIGDPLDDKTQVGPLATKLQVERAEKMSIYLIIISIGLDAVFIQVVFVLV